MNYQVPIESVSVTGEAFVIRKQFEPAKQYDFVQRESCIPIDFQAWLDKQRVDIILVCHDDFHMLRPCLRAVIDGVDKTLNYVVHVVNNACEAYAEGEIEREVESYSAKGYPVHLLALTRYEGHLDAVAEATRGCQGDWLVLVDTRCRVAPGWLVGLLRPGFQDETVAIVSPWSSKRAGPAPGETFQATARKVWNHSDGETHSLTFPATFCAAIRRRDLDAVGGWEVKRYAPGGCELNDLFMRLHQAGKVAVRAEEVYVWDDSPGMCENEWISKAINNTRFMVHWGKETEILIPRKAGKDSVDRLASLITRVPAEELYQLVFVLRAAPVCGMVLAITHLCNYLADLGWNATFACTSLDMTTIRLLPMRFTPMVFQTETELVSVLKRHLHRAVVVAPTYVTCQNVLDICEGNPGLRPVYFIQDDERQFRYPTGAPYGDRAVIEATYRQFTDIIVNSDWVNAMLRDEIGIDRQSQIGIGVDTTMFHPRFCDRPNQKLRVMAHCRPSTPRRGWPFIATVMNACSGLFKFELVTYDEVPEALSFDHAGHLGKVGPEELAREMSTCQVFFEGSEQQGWGMQALEAMSCGCALVSTANKGIDSFGTNGYDCVVIPYGDVPAAVGILKYLHDNLVSDSVWQLRANARDTALSFDWTVVAEEWDRHLHYFLKGT